ncbi:MBL fold metallo-hydrolase [Patulibacter sp.]|uniref:MBL fold metallo-hydrolase n=1 Tax=Patulibacter sp. TaxID=1912859 RepID=UPI00271E5695|nr:MBL fold metallo-hydrolase [Patulibacter sp.]MDO9409567.1 MBL fold metallo-hydrolase [Patulibacter sp.]
MREVADDVFHLPLAPRNSVNAYLIGDVLVDAGVALQAGRVLSAVRGRVVTQHVLTHAHPDHAGGTRKVVDALRIPVRAGARDLPALHAGQSALELPGPLRALGRRFGSFSAVPEAAALRAGDVVGPDFVVLDTPGHSAGHVSFWRERDGVLICGDVVNSMDLKTTIPGLREPPKPLTPDPAQNRQSIRTLADLSPRLVLVGHGPPVTNAATPFREFAGRLPQD